MQNQLEFRHTTRTTFTFTLQIFGILDSLYTYTFIVYEYTIKYSIVHLSTIDWIIVFNFYHFNKYKNNVQNDHNYL